jgi:Uma2 family endonuclease
MNASDLQSVTDRVHTDLSMSYEEYLDWVDEDTHAEWVDGEVIVHMPPLDVHQTILNFLNRLLAEYVEVLELGVVFIAPFEMRLLAQKSARQPDIFVVTKEQLGRLTPERFEGPADLVVEIVSKDSVRRDRQEKFREYQEAGVREYWIIDSRRGRDRADFYRLDDEGQYVLYGTEDDDRVESMVLPGFWLRPAWLWQLRKPPIRSAFLEITGLTPEQAQELDQKLLRRGGDDSAQISP